ncbi:MAG: ATP-binding cassette domain-containing protein [Pyrinomonadaceae bacterium]
MKRNKLILLTLFWGFLIFTFAAVDTFAQRNDDEKVSIRLDKDARQNGYKISENGEKISFQAQNVFDPLKKKVLEGEHELLYSCEAEDSLRRMRIRLSGGVSKRVSIACAKLINPRILILDEPYSN